MAQILNLRRGVKIKNKPKVSIRKSSLKVFKKEAIPLIKEPIAKLVSTLKISQPPQIAWEAPSFYFNPEKRYLSFVIISLVAGGGALLLFRGDMLTAIFLLLSSLVLILYATKRPEISKIVVDQRGVAVGDLIYYYKDLKSFWIHYNPGDLKELSLESRKWYMPYIKVSIENNNPLLIRSLLINFIPEKEHEHSLIDIIARKIGL